MLALTNLCYLAAEYPVSTGCIDGDWIRYTKAVCLTARQVHRPVLDLFEASRQVERVAEEVELGQDSLVER